MPFHRDGRSSRKRKAGLAGSLDELRAQAPFEPFGQARPLDSGADSGGTDGNGETGGTDGGGGCGPRPGGGTGPAGIGTGHRAGGACPACGSTGSRINLTVPLATLTGLAGRPGHLRGTGPVDPKPGANTLNRYPIAT